MKRRGAIVALLLVACLAVYFGKERFLGVHLGSMFLNELVPPEQANDTTRPAAMDPLQMVYLTWAAGDALRHGRLLVEDRHQFASRVERFWPVVLDPLVYVGGVLSLALPLALSYNLGQVVLPLLIMALGFYALVRALGVGRAVAFGFALLCPFIPYRLLNSAMGQHNAASVCLVPIFYWCATQAVLRLDARRWFALAGVALLAIGLSEEHLAVATILFGWPFLVGHVLAFVARTLRQPGRSRVLAWLRTVATQGWPALPSLAALGAIAALERHNLLQQSIVHHVYGYEVVQMYSTEFNELYFHQRVGYHVVLLPVALAGIGVVIAQMRRRGCDLIPIARFVFVLVFVPSALFSLGYVPTAARVLHFDPYRFLFEHVPLLDMQRYPHRMLYTAYVSGLVVAACAVDAAVHRLRERARALLLARAVVVVALTIAAINWMSKAPTTALYDLSRDPDATLHQQIRASAGRNEIVLRLPALSGSMWSDTRVMLTAMRTGGRFFNGYWAFMPRIYRELQPSLQRLGDSGQLLPDVEAALGRVGVRFILADKAYVRPGAIDALRAHPRLELVYEDPGWAYFRLHDN